MIDEIVTEYEESVAVAERHFDVLYNGGCTDTEDFMDYVVISEVGRYGN